ncbi:MAG: hypothetical protein ACRDDZ_01430 [Marinifilaceae bacterium]
MIELIAYSKTLAKPTPPDKWSDKDSQIMGEHIKQTLREQAGYSSDEPLKECGECHEKKPFRFFGHDAKTTDGFTVICFRCRNIRLMNRLKFV